MAEATPLIPRRFSTRRAAEMLGVDITTVYALVRSRKIEHFRIGVRYEFTEDQLKNFVEASRKPALAA